MRLPLQLLLFSWLLTGVVFADDDDDDDELKLDDDDMKDDDDSSETGKEADEDEDEEEDEEEEEDNFDDAVPDAHRYQKMNRCLDLVKTSLTKETLERYVEQMKRDGVPDMEEDKAGAAILLDLTFSCYYNTFLDESLWARAKLPLGANSEEQKKVLFDALFQKDEQTRPKISKKQTTLLQQLLMPPKAEKRLTETDEEKAARKERMKQRAEEREANKGKEKEEKKKKKQSSGGEGGPQMDLPGGLLSMSTKNAALYVLVVLGSIALILLLGVKKLISYQEESNKIKQAKKSKKEGKKTK